eukprot:3937763-Rhodomonas_salina.1
MSQVPYAGHSELPNAGWAGQGPRGRARTALRHLEDQSGRACECLAAAASHTVRKHEATEKRHHTIDSIRVQEHEIALRACNLSQEKQRAITTAVTLPVITQLMLPMHNKEEHTRLPQYPCRGFREEADSKAAYHDVPASSRPTGVAQR